MNQETLQMFKTLTELPATSGFEDPVRSYMRSALEPFADEIVMDRMGSLFGVKHGETSGPKVMVAGHMDEVGFMVAAVTKRGMIRFKPLGGWWNQVLLAQRVQILTPLGSVTGVISSIPPHLLGESQKGKPLEIDNMLIDIGADDREDAERLGIRPGQSIVPICPFTPLANPKKIMAKAWDNRYGVGLAIELMQEVHSLKLPNTLYAGATVQEEVGLRGAVTAANLIQPDIFFALDASPANDMFGDDQAFGHLGKGALLRVLDRTMVTHSGLVEYIRDTAESNRIPHQYFISPGGTDAGNVQLHGIGVPSAVIGICARYVHTAASIIHVDDYAAAKALLVQLVKSLDKSTYDAILSS